MYMIILFCVLTVYVYFIANVSSSSVQECILQLSNDVRIGVNARIDDRYPITIVNVTSVKHIQSSVICAGLFNKQVIPMNGGHSFEGLSTTNAVLLNLDMYHNITIDLTSSYGPAVKVQSGTRLARLYGLLVQSLYPASESSSINATGPHYVLAGGTCPTVGVTGHVVCGGYGMFGRMIGLTSDQIVSMEVVNFKGEAVTVSSTSHADLFWALRGSCSSSFGIISSISFKLHNNVHGPNITVFNPRDASGAQTVINGSASMIQAALWFQSYATYKATPLMTMNINFKANNQIVLEGVFMGPKALALALMLEPLTEGLDGIFTREQIISLFQEGSYLDAIVWWTNDKSLNSSETLAGVTALDPLGERASRRKAKSSLVRGIIDAEGIQTIADLFSNHSINQMEWKAYGGVDPITGTSPYTTHQSPLLRGHLFEAHYSSSWKASSGDNASYIAAQDELLIYNMSLVQTRLEGFSGFSNQSYVGYIDLNSTTDAALLGEVYFGAENAARLRTLRSLVDPLGVLTSETSEYLYPSGGEVKESGDF